jgi:metal-responsive CopG/Arc/MetJ family transcriptional regulator
MSFWATKDKPPKKKRIAFDVEKETLEQIDDLVILTGAASRAELFRDSLRLFEWMTKQQNAGYEIVLKKGDDETVVELSRAP